MKENIRVPWKRMIMASTISVFLIFVFGFVVALLCNYYVISFSAAEKLMLAAVFLGSFLGNLIVTYREKSIIYTIISAIITFIMLNLIGMLTAFRFNGKYTILILIILCISAIISCVVKALFK